MSEAATSRRRIAAVGATLALAGCGGGPTPHTPEAVRSCFEDAGMDVALDGEASGSARDLRVPVDENLASLRIYPDEETAVEREQDRVFYAESEDERLFDRRRNVFVEWDEPPTPAQAATLNACLPD